MSTSLRTHPDTLDPKQELDILLARLPSGTETIRSQVREIAKSMSTAGLRAFVDALRTEVDTIMIGENSFERQVARILGNPAIGGGKSRAANNKNFRLTA